MDRFRDEQPPPMHRGWSNNRAFHPYPPPDDGAMYYVPTPDPMTSPPRDYYSHGDVISAPRHRRPNDEDGAGKKGDEEEREGRSNARKKPFSFAEYMISTTGFQGPGKMWESPYKWLKVLWLLGFLVACGIMTFQLIQLFKEFFSYPTKTEVNLKFSPLPLPALTLCNMNPVRLSYAKNLSCPLQDLFRIPDSQRSEDCQGITHSFYDLNDVSYYCDDCDGYYDDYYDYYYDDVTPIEDLDDFGARRENIALHLGNESSELRRQVGHQLNDLIVDCYIFGRPCVFRNITAFLSREYGNCYTLSKPNLKATRSGPEAALELTLNLEAEEFIESYKTGYGIRVVLHENGTRPFPSSEGFTLSSGSETDIAVSLTQIKRKGGRYGDCGEGGIVAAVSGYKYTISNCQDQCVNKRMVQACGCIPLDDEGEEPGSLLHSTIAVNTPVRFCDTEAEYKCTYREWASYVNDSLENGQNTCSCHTPCDELVYTSTLSSRSWPSVSHVRVLEEQVCKLNPESPKCFYLGENFTMETVDVRRSFTRLRLYYERLNYEFVEEKPFYDAERFLSDIGGTLGLWIGVTALGLLELFELLLLAVSACRRKMRTPPRS